MAVIAETPAQYQPLIEQASTAYGVPDDLLSALLHQESGFDPLARSAAGALGIAQFLPSTARGLGVDPLDPNSAIPGAAKLLASYYRRFGSWELALAAYNAGPGAVADAGNAIPPFAETQNYVAAIMAKAGAVAGASAHAAANADPITGAINSASQGCLTILARWLWLILALVLVVVGIVLLVAEDLSKLVSRHADELPAKVAA